MSFRTELARVAGKTLGPSRLRPLLRRGIGGRHVTVCLHRVHEGLRRLGEKNPAMSIQSGQLDELMDRLHDLEPGSITVTFDDGYADAAEYLMRRAHRWPDAQFIFFVCPRKTELRQAFSWDCEERTSASADHRAFRLATPEECRSLARLRNVRLGNHSNSHHRLSKLTSEELRAELWRSTEDFQRLFGRTADFAVPYGTPKKAFGPREVNALRAYGYQRIWSTEPRVMTPKDEQRGVLPRFALDGTWTVSEMLTWIAVRALTPRAPERQAA